MRLLGEVYCTQSFAVVQVYCALVLSCFSHFCPRLRVSCANALAAAVRTRSVSSHRHCFISNLLLVFWQCEAHGAAQAAPFPCLRTQSWMKCKVAPDQHLAGVNESLKDGFHGRFLEP